MKSVVITGVSRGIGYSIVKKFLKENDYKIFAISKNEIINNLFNNERVGKNTKIFTYKFDLLSSDYTPLFDFIKENTEKVDILINNAGILIKKNFDTISNEEIYVTFIVNFFAPFQLIQGLYNLNLLHNSHIVNIGSMGGFQGTMKFPGLSIYSSSKASLACLTECLAVELEEKKISINCLALGSVQTEMLEEAFPGHIAPVNPDEIATFVYDFAIHGSKYFNGKIIPVSSKVP